MSQAVDQQRARRATLAGGVAALVVILLGGIWYFGGGEPAPAPQAEPAPAAAQATPPAVPAAPATRATEVPQPESPPPSAALVRPTFDVARIAPEGTAVMAGRAPGGAKVEVRGNGKAVGSTDSAADGSWALVIDTPLPEGALELSLEATMPDGQTILSDQVVLVDVPVRSKPGIARNDAPAEPPVAVLTGRAQTDVATTRVLQGPAGAPTGELPAGAAPTLDVVEYAADGAPVLTGRAKPGAIIRVYLGDRLVAETTAGPDGQWRLTPGEGIDPGRYTLRLDEIDDQGQVVSRRELPFERAAPEAAVAAAATPEKPSSFTVQPGNSLWRIARLELGDGIRYIDLYRANQGQIRNPDLIYPGQILSVPR